MFSWITRTSMRFLALSIAISAITAFAYAQEDPDPNSPTPILLSEKDTTRALATDKLSRGKLDLNELSSQAFAPNSKAALFVTNLSLMDGEGASAFRVYARDNANHLYRFPVFELSEVTGYPGVYRVVILVRDELQYWPEAAPGDLTIYLTWRGLSSNEVLFGFGQTGGMKPPAGTVPTPLGTKPNSYTSRTGKTLSPEYVGYRWSGDRIRFLEQATFGPTPDLDARVRRIGLRTWLAEQFLEGNPSNPIPNLDLKATDNTVAMPNGCGNPVDAVCNRDYYTMYQPQIWLYKEALYGTPQLRHRVNWALHQLWVISGVDTQQSSHMFAYYQLINKSAFGNWRTLMYDMTVNPGMGNYLDMIRSTKTNPNENYPREILQLFNIGLFMLNQDGTLQLDGQGNPIPTYDQNVVNNLTKVFTGWRGCQTADADPNSTCPNALLGIPDYKDPMSLAQANHDVTAKTLLSYPGSTTSNVAACTGCTAAQIRLYAYNSLNQALDNIYNHPNVAPFVSKYLIQQLVTSDPTPAYVGRVSAVFNATRNSPTQMKEVVKAILLDPEARGDNKTDPTYGKLREPVQLMTNLYRQIGVTSADGLSLSDGDINRFASALAQNAFTSPTVFNFYPPTYVVPGTTLLGPEFAIFNTGTAIGRANLGNSIIYGQINVSNPNTPNGTKLNLTELQAIAAADTTSNQLLDVLNRRLMHNTMSASMRSSILTATNALASTDPLGRARAALYLVFTSSQYQVQR